MSRSVVCGVDWSDESISAVNVAARLSRRLDATLVLAHAIEESAMFPYGGVNERERSRYRAQTETTRLLQRLQTRFSSVDVDGRVLFGPPADELAELAAEEQADLIVVGSRGRRGVKAALFGSVSSALIRAADRPVLIVRSGTDGAVEAIGDRSPIVCGVDDSPQSRSAARVAAALARRLGAELVLVHAYSPARLAATIPAAGIAPPVDHEALEERQRRAGAALLRQVSGDATDGGAVRTRLEADAPASAVESCAETEQAALIVVGTHGRGPLASAFLGSTSAALAAAASVPVVLVPERAALRDLGGRP
jgi:nucleotide-binding universal stress UspA family protein